MKRAGKPEEAIPSTYDRVTKIFSFPIWIQARRCWLAAIIKHAGSRPLFKASVSEFSEETRRKPGLLVIPGFAGVSVARNSV